MMAVQALPIKDMAEASARTARDAFMDQATYFAGLPHEAWEGPTGCSQWTMHDLAGHVVGEGVWFLNLVRGATVGEQPLAQEVWEELKHRSGCSACHTDGRDSRRAGSGGGGCHGRATATAGRLRSRAITAVAGAWGVPAGGDGA